MYASTRQALVITSHPQPSEANIVSYLNPNWINIFSLMSFVVRLTGQGPHCPPSTNKPNKTICNEEYVCYMGVSIARRHHCHRCHRWHTTCATCLLHGVECGRQALDNRIDLRFLLVDVTQVWVQTRIPRIFMKMQNNTRISCHYSWNSRFIPWEAQKVLHL